jgi:hypothetical protein
VRPELSKKSKHLYHDGITSLLQGSDLVKSYEIQASSMEPLQVMTSLVTQKVCLPTSRSQIDFKNAKGHLSAALKADLLKIKEAAILRLKLGDFKSYCESMVNLGEWDKAIAVSPGVSLEYWKQLIKRFNKLHDVRNESNSQRFSSVDTDAIQEVVIPYLMVSNDTRATIDALNHLNLDDEAFLVASVADSRAGLNGNDEATPVQAFTFEMADKYVQMYSEFSPRHAAAWSALKKDTKSVVKFLKKNGDDDYAQAFETLYQ